MTKEEFQAASVKRINEILGERATEIETWIAGLVGLGFSEGIKHAIKSNTSKKIVSEWARRLAVLSLALESIKTTVKFAQAGKVIIGEKLQADMMTLIDGALKEVPKGGGE